MLLEEKGRVWKRDDAAAVCKFRGSGSRFEAEAPAPVAVMVTFPVGATVERAAV